MMDRLRTLIWYAALVAVILVLHYVAKTYTVVVVDEEYRFMEPTMGPRNTCFLDRSRSAVESLRADDLIVFQSYDGRKTRRMFGRVLAGPGATVASRSGRILVGGSESADLPPELTSLDTGLIVPRDTVFVTFDSPRASLPLAKRLVAYRNIIGRIIGK